MVSVQVKSFIFIVVGNLSSAVLLGAIGKGAVFLLWLPLSITMIAGIRHGWRDVFYCLVSSVGLHGVVASLSAFWSGNLIFLVGVFTTQMFIAVVALSLRERVVCDIHALEKRIVDWERVSKTDALTGLLNRRGFLARLNAYFEKEEASRQAAALLFIDLDGFKSVNDCLGHEYGDNILCAVAQVLIGNIRNTDYVSRVGGDEFVIFLSGLDKEARAIEIGRRIVEEVRTIPVEARTSLVISASIGVCILPNERVSSAVSALSLADHLMYRAKQSGKDRVCVLSGCPDIFPDG